MKIRITQPGLLVPVGRVMDVRGAVPASWAGKYEVIDPPEPKADKPAMTQRKSGKGK